MSVPFSVSLRLSQLILSILLHIHISKASSIFIGLSSFLVVHVCDPYSIALHSIDSYHPFLLIPDYSSPLRSSFLFENVSSITTLLLIGLFM